MSSGQTSDSATLEGLAERLERRLEAMDARLEALARSRSKAVEWVAMLSEHVRSLDAFREEVRASFEPLYAKLDTVEEGLRLLRHAMSDISRRVEHLERRRKAS